MILIFGLRVVLKTIGSGQFHCPNEHADRNYVRKRARRYFTVFFVPLIPMKVLGEVVECEGCHTRFDASVLSVPTSGELADHLAGLVRVAVVAVLRAVSPPSAAQRAMAVDIVGRYVPGAEQSWIDADLAAIDPADLDAHLAVLAPVLAEEGRESLLGNLTWVAAADGALSPAGRAQLDRIGAGLGMTQAHIRGVVDSVLDVVAARRGTN